MEERMTEELNEDTDFENSIIEPLEPDTEISELDEQADSTLSEQAEVADSDDDQMPDDEQTNQLQSDQEVELTLESVIEAVLFASDEPLTVARLANIVEATTKQIREHIDNLNKKYEANNNAFRIEQIAGGYQMLTLSCYNHWLKQLLRARSETKLSPAAMETLAIIAYKQPVIRADIEAIRGVAVGEVIRSLSYKGLVKIVGRAEVLGRPMLYGTTKKFLEVFGLNTLKDLPKIEELKKPPN
jgi:segregation and condensation protein B